jgi:serine/threonine-protein kinase
MLVGQQIGPFAVEQEIGCGAMGRVYRARYEKNGSDVALKIISSGVDSNPTALARFEREAAILKKLNHPHIVRLYATGRFRRTPFYVMEFVEGETLEAILQRKGHFTWEEVVALGQQICAALQHAHGQGIIHRDLKPANIMVTADDSVKLTDFGIAKGLEVSQLTATNSTVGTASYMSPEQCRGERNLTHKSDLYSLGVVFYELLTGRRPFLAETTLDMFLAHTQGKFERPSRLVLDIPIWLDTLVCQMMEKDPEKRPFDAAMIAKALEDTLEKVAAQRSAGVDVANARRIDVPRGKIKADETDREAARLLRAATTKVKVKRRQRQFYERGWFVGAGIAVLLLGIGAMVWAVLKPPAAEDLYESAKISMAKDDPEEWDKARDGPIKTFLDHYADRNDEEAAQMRAWADKVDLRTRERQFLNRLGWTPEGEGERLAQAAVRHEDAGDLDMAMDGWQALEKFKENKDLDQRAWGLLASKRLRDLDEVTACEEEIRYSIQQFRSGKQPFKPDSPMERRAGTALYAELFNDYTLAFDTWQRIKQSTQKDAKQRTWFLLAASKMHTLGAQIPKGISSKQARRQLLEDKLEEIKQRKNKPQEASLIARDILFLYDKDDDPQLAPFVEEARRLAKELERPSK